MSYIRTRDIAWADLATVYLKLRDIHEGVIKITLSSQIGGQKGRWQEGRFRGKIPEMKRNKKALKQKKG